MIPEVLTGLQESFKQRGVDNPMKYEFIYELYAKEYKSEQKLTVLIIILGIISIVMATIGMVAVISFHLNNQTKEISIRKILGASRLRLLSLLSRQYFFMAALSLIIALPFITVIMEKWLASYAYRIAIGPVHYISVAVYIVLFTLVTVGIKAMQKVNGNMVDNLR